MPGCRADNGDPFVDSQAVRHNARRQVRSMCTVLLACVWVWVATTIVRSFLYNYEYESRRREEANMVMYRVCGDRDGLGLARDFVKCEEANIASQNEMVWLDALHATAKDVFHGLIMTANQEISRSIQTIGLLGVVAVAAVVCICAFLRWLLPAQSGHMSEVFEEYRQLPQSFKYATSTGGFRNHRKQL